MADEVVDLLHVNDITIMRTLDPEDILADWEDMKLLARILIDNELQDETAACLPIIYEGVGGRPVTRWELGSLQVPTDCCLFALIITTTRRFDFFNLEFQRRLDGIWNIAPVMSKNVCGRFRAQVFLHHPPSGFHRAYHPTLGAIPFWDIPPTEPCDETTWSLLGSLPTEQVLLLGMQRYNNPGACGHLKRALPGFERVLEDPNIDPGLSQILETAIPFLYCLERGYSSCLDVALQVLQTFPGLPNDQLDAQSFLLWVVVSVVTSFEWYDHIPLAIKSITAPFKLLLHSTSPRAWTILDTWFKLAYCLASHAKEVLPLMDLAVEFRSVFPTLEDFESLALIRAILYFKQGSKPDGPSVGMTLGAAEFVMHSLASREHSDAGRALGLGEAFAESCMVWLVGAQGSNCWFKYKDRLLSLVTWQLSNSPWKLLLGREDRATLKLIQLNGTPTNSEIVIASMARPPPLDDNDKQFIEEIHEDLSRQRKGNLPAKYPKGAAKLVTNVLMDADLGFRSILTFGIVATIARTLRLPEAFKAYELYMSFLDSEAARPVMFAVHGGALTGADRHHLMARDAISCASETENYISALQWSDQGCSQIWNWLFHPRLSVSEGSATDPVIARKLQARPPWIDSWTRRQPGEPRYNFQHGHEFYHAIPRYNRLPGFEHFLRPKTAAEITSLAEVLGGPIVYLNPNRHSAHALAVLPGLDDVVYIPLPRLENMPMLRAISVNFMKSPQTFLQEGPLMQERWERLGHTVPKPGQRSTPSVDFKVSGALFLKYLWCVVVKPVLDGLGIQRAQTATADMPRIWWCPSGPLIGLPIHAAGDYADGGQVISDYVVSSYFPSASALAYATRPKDPSQKFSLLTIANPTGAGLPGTELELEKIEKHTQAATLSMQELTRGEATVEAVKKGMENASWAHFACHGVADPHKPWESALILANHTRLTMREISEMSLPHAEFTYLSACQTAKGVAEAPEQSVHLSTGMMACGYRSIIGTLWSIKDEYAPIVADRVYAKMLEDGQPDYKRAAYALHDAVQALRKEHNVPFATWLPFIHVGV